MKLRLKAIARVVLFFWVLLGVLAPFLANSSPLVVVQNGHLQFPFLSNRFEQISIELSSVLLWPPIRYAATDLDVMNSNYVHPLAKQIDANGNSLPNGKRHWLGTGKLGQDVLAGMVWGCRQSLWVAGIGTGVALLLGLLLGGLAGLLPMITFRTSYFSFTLSTLVLFLGMFYSMKTLPQLHYSPIAGIGTILLAIAISCFLLVKPIGRVRLFTFETDALFDAFAQWFVALPKLILLIALVAIARLNGFQIGLLLGFFFWPAIGLTTRSSFNRIRETDYFRATRVLGLPFSRQLFLHAMPNTKQVVFSASVTVFVAVVLLEASLSFLGLQADADYVSWGSLLNQARENFAAWWVFVPPGAGLFSFIWAAKWISETGKSF